MPDERTRVDEIAAKLESDVCSAENYISLAEIRYLLGIARAGSELYKWIDDHRICFCRDGMRCGCGLLTQFRKALEAK